MADQDSAKRASKGAGKWVPTAEEAERSVVAALLTSPEVYDDIQDLIVADDFADPGCAAVFRAVVACEAAGRPIDQVTVAEELRRDRSLTKAGGLDGLKSLVAYGAGVTNTRAHAEIVLGKAQLRRVIDAGRQMATAAMEPEADPLEVRETAEELVFELGKERSGGSMVVMAEAVARMQEELKATRNQLLLGHPTGFEDLDKLTGGFQGGQLIVVAARPGMGKSAIALQMARHIAATTGQAVPFLSYEMSTSELTIRMLASALRFDVMSLRQGFLPSGMDLELSRAAEAMAELPLYIDDNPPAAIGGVRSAMRRLARRVPIGAIFVDYLQLLESERRGRSTNRNEEVSDISRGLKRLASELGVPVIALSQLSRAVEERPNKRPQLSDLRDSGCVTADTRLLLADGSEMTIGEMVRTGVRNVAVQCVNADGELTVGNLTHAFPSGRKMTYRVRTASGHEVEATANHPFRTWEGWTPLAELGVGSRVAVPRRSATPAAPVAWDRDELLLLAHLIGDGCTVEGHATQYTNTDPSNLSAVAEAAERRFGLLPRLKDEGTYHQLYLAMPTPGGQVKGPIRNWLEPLGLWDKRSWEKFLPAAVLQASDEDLAWFLHHLWATDGCLTHKSGRTSCYYATTSRRLADDVKLALSRFGIVARTRTIDNAGRGRVGYQVWVSGGDDQERFCRRIGTHGQRGECIPDILADLDDKARNTNVGTLPEQFWTDVRATMARRCMTTRQFAANLGASYRGSAHFKGRPGREAAARTAATLDDEHLMAASRSDMFWDRIVSIDEIGEHNVFDATVEEHHNFIGNGVILHNSIEQDANAVLFVFRESIYNANADATLAELILAKQRSGPQGTVHLEWDGPSATFKTTNRRPASLPTTGGGGGGYGRGQTSPF